MTPIIGLTGGIGSGKSLVAARFAELGITVVNADTVAREVVAKGEPALEKIREHFGKEILLPTGELDRRKLRGIIFNDPEQKKWLENLLHPIIRVRMVDQLQAAASPYAILESPLLLETDQHLLVEKIIVVDVDEATQIARASARDGADVEQIKNIIASQMPRAEKLQKADFVIDNGGSVEATYRQVEGIDRGLRG
ncbi:MAG: dephospho-CoA kinase [Cellvibrionaceae bacterium]|nr:dephospho-CoA kinase [Cellvibrionaceae bacterium]